MNRVQNPDTHTETTNSESDKPGQNVIILTLDIFLERDSLLAGLADIMERQATRKLHGH